MKTTFSQLNQNGREHVLFSKMGIRAGNGMGRRVMDQWVKWITFWMGHMGHGSAHVDPRPVIRLTQ